MTGNNPAHTSTRIFTKNDDLRAHYSSLEKGDIFIGRVRCKTSEEHMLLDLVERGIILFPSALSQQVCRSKTAQALLFADFMVPHTLAVHDQHDMMAAVNYYHRHFSGRVVTKLDRKNGGLGIHLWPGIEDVYNQAVLSTLPFPFVLQPFIADSMDIRVIILDCYEEAYRRENTDNFRKNLHCGGRSSPCELTEQQRKMCRLVMQRGKFPYAHLDLMVTGTGETYLSEINLRGGIKGAVITSQEYMQKIDAIHAAFAGEAFCPQKTVMTGRNNQE